MWTEQLAQPDANTWRLTLFANASPMTFRQVLLGWQEASGFGEWFSTVLARLPFAAFFWELPALTLDQLDAVFECVFVDSPQLVSVPPEPEVFANYFQRAGAARVCSFANLGGDALLVVPTPAVGDERYSHIADFVRSAPMPQQSALWQELARCCLQQLSTEPLWISTSGLGVYWVHIRLDCYPKYYTYVPYKSAGLAV